MRQRKMHLHLLLSAAGIFMMWMGAFAAEPDRTLVSSGPFVRIYDPSVGEKQPWYINDHCFIRAQDGVWHLFGITHHEPARPLSETNFAHATARRLLQQPWDPQPFALTVASEAPWREAHLWAPHVIWHSNLYYMFYCAGDEDHTRYKIHLATSPDLRAWTRSPKIRWWWMDLMRAIRSFCDSPINGSCITPPTVARKGATTSAYVTSRDLLTWTNRGVAFTDPETGTFGGPTESPFVRRAGGVLPLYRSARRL